MDAEDGVLLPARYQGLVSFYRWQIFSSDEEADEVEASAGSCSPAPGKEEEPGPTPPTVPPPEGTFDFGL